MLRLVKRLEPVLLQLEQLPQSTPYAEACECPLALQKSGMMQVGRCFSCSRCIGVGHSQDY